MHQLIKKLDCLWRLFGTGFSFVVFGIAGLFLSIFIFPLLYVFVRSQEDRQLAARRLVGYAFGAFVRMMRALGVLSYEIEGLGYAGPGHNQLIIANHPTLIDVVFLVSLFPLADCVVKEAVIKNPFMRGVVLPAKYISSDDPGELLDTCTKRLLAGNKLLLFPEGTRSTYGQRLKFKLGAAAVAYGAGAEVLPVIITCTQPGFLAKHVAWHKVPPERPFISIQIQPPVSMQQLIPGNMPPRQSIRLLNTVLSDLFENEINKSTKLGGII